MLTASNAHATITRSYDAAHRQLTETQTLAGLAGTHAFTYLYDSDGNLSRHTRPDGSFIDYAWNARNLLASVTADAPPPLATYTYNLRDQIASTVVESSLFTATRSYDNAGRLTGVTNGALDTTGYTLSADGRRTAATRNGATDTYSYDAARQVTSAALDLTAGTYNNSYTYNLAGNRTNATTNGVPTTYLSNLVNEYTSIGGTTPTYDANGNLLTDPLRTLTWDINNQLITASNGSGGSASYQYDALGRRTKRSETIGGVTTHTWFLTNGWNVELEHDGSTWSSRHTWGLDLSNTLQGAGGVGGLIMVEMLPSGGGAPVPSFPTYDGNGNITAWVNASGTVIARQRYDAYGNIVEQTGTAPSNYGFSTKPLEKVTGLHYYGYRYYAPTTGRWPSRDPIEEKGGWNLYGFVVNDGVNQIDRLGQKPCSEYKKVRVIDGVRKGRTDKQNSKPQERNGCGTGGWDGSLVPDSYFWSVFFNDACGNHDECYGTCGAKKSKCDKQLEIDMANACKAKYGKFDPNLYLCMAQAATYKNVLLVAGGPGFESGQDGYCQWECCDKE